MLDQKLAQDLVGIALKQIEVALKFKTVRLQEISASEAVYSNEKKKTLKTRFNIALPVLSGFVDTLMAKIDDPPKVIFEPGEEADILKAKKIQAAWEMFSSSTLGDYSSKDLDAKKLAIFSGRGIFKFVAKYSKTKFEPCLYVEDHYNFLCEPYGGGNLEEHLFLGDAGVFLTKYQIEEGVKDGTYDKENSEQIISNTSKDIKELPQEYNERLTRFKSLGLDPENNSYVGQNVSDFVDWFMEYEGVRYNLLIHVPSKLALRAIKWKEEDPSNLWPQTSYATHKDLFNFWSKSFCDDIRPTAEYIKIVLNQALDNRDRRNYGQRAFDDELFKDPTMLQWGRDKTVGASVVAGKSLQQGIYEFQTPEITGSIDLASFLDGFLGKKTGITSEAQGVSDKDKKVGIYYGDMQQVADRIGLINKNYSQCWAEIGRRFVNALVAHMPEKLMVKVIGANGVEWQELTKEDLKTNRPFNIKVISQTAEIQASMAKTDKRIGAIGTLIGNVNFANMLNKKWVVENILKSADVSDDEVKVALDSQNEYDQEVLAKAAQAIQDIMDDKKPELYRGATTAFIQKIINFATDKKVDDNVYAALMSYAQANMPAAMENATRKAMAQGAVMAAAGTAMPQAGGQTQQVANDATIAKPAPMGGNL